MDLIHSEERTLEDEDDHRLAQRLCTGDVDAYAALLLRHRKRVEGFLYRLFWDRQKAEDGAQEVFLRLWVARQRYEPRARLLTFLYRIAHRYWQDEMRKTQARPLEEAWGEEERSYPLLSAPPATDPLHQLFLRYRQRQIQAAISRLPERYGIVFVLAHLEGHRIAEIAEILHIPEGTVKSRLHTAVRLLRGWLQSEEEFESDAGASLGKKEHEDDV